MMVVKFYANEIEDILSHIRSCFPGHLVFVSMHLYEHKWSYRAE